MKSRIQALATPDRRLSSRSHSHPVPPFGLSGIEGGISGTQQLLAPPRTLAIVAPGSNANAEG